MDPLRAVALLPFVPSGKEYDASRRLFRALGFEELSEKAGYAHLKNGPCEFILQRYDERSFAENYMVSLEVPDLDAWWEAVAKLDLEQRHPGFRIKPPQLFPWGREVNFIDLAGVCWHVRAPRGAK